MNEFVDMHVHSKFSIDGMSTMEDYCLIAGKTGTRVIFHARVKTTAFRR